MAGLSAAFPANAMALFETSAKVAADSG